MLNFNSVKNSYERYAPYYDKLFGLVLQPGRILLAKKTVDLNSKKILEVGVGTGLVLPLYSKKASITGIDVSIPMLNRARALVEKEGWNNISLFDYDGKQLPFESDSFDCVTLPYVYSVTPNPHEFIQECWRVCAPNGHLILVNHFSDTPEKSYWTILETLLQSFSSIIGFKSKFSYKTYIDSLPWEKISVESTNFANLSRVVVFKK